MAKDLEKPSETPTFQQKEAKQYRNQEAMEACMKAHPGLTEDEFKEMAENLGF